MGRLLVTIVVGYFCLRGIELDSAFWLKRFIYGKNRDDWNTEATLQEDLSKAVEKIKNRFPLN